MGKRIFTTELIGLLKEWYPIVPMEELLEIVPLTKSQIKTAASRFELTKKMKLFSWRYGDELLLIELYPFTLNSELAELFDKRESQIQAAAFKLNLHKTKEFMHFHAMKTAFKPGTVPPNKGKKQEDYMSAEQIAKTAGTRFKKGQVSHTELFDGAITLRADKRGVEHKYIRISKGKWEELQRYNWEQVNGKIPKGMCLRSIDGNALNVDPSNWRLITQKENRILNSGSISLTDTYVANILSIRNPELKKELQNHPEIIALKRTQLQLNRAIKEHGK